MTTTGQFSTRMILESTRARHPPTLSRETTTIATPAIVAKVTTVNQTAFLGFIRVVRNKQVTLGKGSTLRLGRHRVNRTKWVQNDKHHCTEESGSAAFYLARVWPSRMVCNNLILLA